MSAALRQPPSIGRSLLGWFVGVIVLSFACTVRGLYYLVLKPTADEIAVSEMTHATEQIETRIASLVGQIERVLLTMRDQGELGEISLTDVPSFNRLVIPVIKHRPAVSAAILADSHGRA